MILILTGSVTNFLKRKMCINKVYLRNCFVALCPLWGWSGGAKVLGNLPMPGRPTNLDYSRARACCACSRCGLALFGHFFSYLSFLSSFSLSLGDGSI